MLTVNKETIVKKTYTLKLTPEQIATIFVVLGRAGGTGDIRNEVNKIYESINDIAKVEYNYKCNPDHIFQKGGSSLFTTEDGNSTFQKIVDSFR